MTTEVKVLDHGHVKLLNLAGPTRRATYVQGGEIGARPFDADDVDSAQAARMSFDAMDPDRSPEEDHNLSRYLMRNWHTSPFEMIEAWLDMKLPIFVARQFVRHRTVSINEVSARYITLPEEWYIPEIVGGKPVGGAKQGQSDVLPLEVQQGFQIDLNQDCQNGYDRYIRWITRGVAPEHARLFLHVNHYTHWLWKQDMHNVMGFLRLRDHFHAQIEAQKYAKGVDSMIRAYLPKTMELYDEFRRMKEPPDLDVLLAEFAKNIAASKDSAAHNGSFQGGMIANGHETLLNDIKRKLRQAGLGK